MRRHSASITNEPTYKKLMPRSDRLFWIIGVKHHKITVAKNWILRKLPNDPALPSPSTILSRQGQTEKTNRSWVNPSHQIADGEEADHETPMTEATVTKELGYPGIEKSTVDHGLYNIIAFTVRKGIAHAKKNKRIQIIVRRYGYKSTEDTVEGPEHAPRHLVIRY